MVQIHRCLDGTTKGVGDSPADDLLVYTLENQHDNRKFTRIEDASPIQKNGDLPAISMLTFFGECRIPEIDPVNE